jgi:hypothetical protein
VREERRTAFLGRLQPKLPRRQVAERREDPVNPRNLGELPELGVDCGKLNELKADLIKSVVRADATLMIDCPLEAYLGRIESGDRRAQPRYVPPEAYDYCACIEKRGGKPLVETYNKLLLVYLIDQFEDRAKSKNLPESVRVLYYKFFGRTLARLDSSRKAFYLLENSSFRRDLAICRLRLLPCGIELIDEDSGVPRRLVTSGGLRQALRAVGFFLFRTRGFRPFYESHMDGGALRRFSPEEFELCYLRIAELLELNPHVKGFFSSSWWNDPRLAIISPTLAFLHKKPEQNGALNLRGQFDEKSVNDALMFSTKRRQLYEAGEYQPRVYTVVWARKDLIRWARKIRAQRASNPQSSGACSGPEIQTM